jgi:hypothetical protein
MTIRTKGKFSVYIKAINIILFITVPLSTCLILAILWAIVSNEELNTSFLYKTLWIPIMVIIAKIIKYKLKDQPL